MPKVFTSRSQKTGEIGEHLAARYLISKGYKVIERNYTKKWGEIDIVAKKNKILYFFEVKTLQRDLSLGLTKTDYSPLENVSGEKLRRFGRCVQTYMLEQKTGDTAWEFGVIAVLLDQANSSAKVELHENLTLS